MKCLNTLRALSPFGRGQGEGALVCVLLLASAASATPVYNIVPLGFDDLEHTRNDGYKYNVGLQLNEAGQVIGNCDRYNGGSTLLGQSAWLYDGATTIDIGLTGSEHTRNDGYKSSAAFQLNEAGQVGGYSNRYNGGSDLGRSAWLYDGATTIDIGLNGAEYTRNDGYKASDVRGLNQAGQVSGISYRYNGSTFFGVSAWLYDGATTIDIGLTGSEHTRNDGYKYSSANQLNKAGQVGGYSFRYNGSTDLGVSAWLYDGATTIDIGLNGAEYTRNDGYKYSNAELLNEAGQVSGSSTRYNRGSTDLGQSVWLNDGATTIDIGLKGAEHTRNDGYKLSYANQLNKAGQVSGLSYRYNGGSTDFGRSAWLFNGVTTTDIGLIGAEHIRNDGYKRSFTQQLNEAGQVSGTSLRYNGGSGQLGQDAWLYDPVLDQTFSLQFSTRSDGYAYSSAGYLGDDGLTLGTYTLFDALDKNLGNRAFYFTIADGLHDLGSLVEGGLAANGWDSLANAIRANGLGQILGHGKLTSQSAGQMVYLLTPVVPEPSTFALAAVGVFGLVMSRRMRELMKSRTRMNNRQGTPMNRFARRVSMAIALAACAILQQAQPVAHAAPVRTVALTGQPAPGTPSGVNYVSFISFPVLNDVGQTAFYANITDGRGIWSEGYGSLTLVARSGSQAPGTPSGVNYSSFFPPVLNDAGQTAFRANLIGSGAGIWSEGSGSLALVAREGSQAPGTPSGVNYSSFSGSPLLNNAGQTAFSAGLTGSGVGFTNDQGIWSEGSGSLALVARGGDHAPGTPSGVNYDGNFAGDRLVLNSAGQTAFWDNLTDGGGGIWSEGSGSLALVARSGDHAPGTPSGVNFDVFGVTGSPVLNNAGQTAFSAGVGTGVVVGIWSEGSGSLALVAAQAHNAPGTPSGVYFNATSSSFKPVLNDAGQTAFRAGLAGSGVDSTNDQGIWSEGSGSLALVARTGSHAPGTPSGVNYGGFGSFAVSSVLNNAGQTAFSAFLTGSGVESTNNQGIWATDRTGAMQLIARSGDPLEVAPGDLRTISLLNFLGGSGNSDGRPSRFNNLGQLVFSATFTDGSSGIFVSNLVAVPEPSSLLLAALAGAGLLLRGRVRKGLGRRGTLLQKHCGGYAEVLAE